VLRRVDDAAFVCNFAWFGLRATTRFAVGLRPRFVKKVKEEKVSPPASTLALRRPHNGVKKRNTGMEGLEKARETFSLLSL
jgi:hypothetical protein